MHVYIKTFNNLFDTKYKVQAAFNDILSQRLLIIFSLSAVKEGKTRK